jgi:flagellar motor protein MotB
MKEVRHVRVEHRPKSALNHDEGQNWAVSYSDLLMVLMSFFVIFFSFNDPKVEDKKEQKNLLEKIAVEIQDQKITKVPQNKNPPVAVAQKTEQNQTSEKISPNPKKLPDEAPVNPVAAKFSAISKTLKTNDIPNTLSQSSNTLTIDLPDNLYRQKEFIVNDKVQKYLVRILGILKRDASTLKITFIGHTDSNVISRPGLYLSNNTDLSSLRASRALSVAIKMGFDQNSLSSQGVQSSIRNTRSLSIKIEPKS